MTTKTFELKPFQSTSEGRMLTEKRHFLLYQMGLGKTPTTVSAGYKTQEESWLILCPKNAIRTWEDHIKEWFNGLDALSGRDTPYAIFRWRKKYQNAPKRRALWNQRVPDCINVYLMTYAAFIQDHEHIPHQFKVIICDEAKRIRNRDSAAYKILKHRCKEAKFFWPMTGTPGKLPSDLFTLFNLADPKYYSSYWRFVSAFHYVMKNEWGRPEILGIRNRDAWYRTLRSRASVVTKDMVKDQIGAAAIPIQRQPLYVELDDDQTRIYRELSEEMMAVTDDKLILASTSLTRTLRFRQLLVCPKILSPSLSYGSALEDLVTTLQDTDPHVVIFTPFTDAFPHIQGRLNLAGYNYIYTLSGNITPDEQMDRIQAFRQNRGIIICSILYAQSFSLEPASECFFLGYEWDPEDNRQAEERLQRLTTTYPINAYYYAYEGTYDDQQVDIVCIKHRQALETFDIRQVGLKFD